MLQCPACLSYPPRLSPFSPPPPQQVLKRRGEVEQQLEVELALGMLFGDDSKGVAGLERASKQALHRLCQELLAEMTAASQVRPEAAMWREAKSGILRDCLLATARFM